MVDNYFRDYINSRIVHSFLCISLYFIGDIFVNLNLRNIYSHFKQDKKVFNACLFFDSQKSTGFFTFNIV